MKLSKNSIQFIVIGFIAGFLGYMLLSVFTGNPKKNHPENVHTQEQTQEIIYTCSMHPQIRQNEPGKCPICAMELIPVSGQKKSNTAENHFNSTMTKEALALADIQTHQVGRMSGAKELHLTGRIGVNEQTLAVITANFSGRIEKLNIDFTGQTVKAGQKLVSIYSPELINAHRELIESARHKDENPRLYWAVREKLRLWQITEAQIKVMEASEELSEFTIYSRLSGVVIKRNVSLGDYVNKGTVLFEIADLSTVWVLLDAYERDLPFIKNNQKITFSISSRPGKEFSSEIVFIDPLINQNTRTATVRAVAANHDSLLKPDMFVKAKIHISSPFNEDTLIIPRTALLWTGKRSVVYVKSMDTQPPNFEMREISIGLENDNFYPVESGLLEGEEIVTNGLFAIDAAAQLNGKYSMMNRPENKSAEVSKQFLLQFDTILKHYFELKNNLVASDFKKSAVSAGKIVSLYKQTDQAKFTETSHQEWIKQKKNLEQSLDKLFKAKDLEEQRIHFSTLSNTIIELATVFGTESEAIYVDFCPMAFDNQGAFWISEFKEIRNPYFGDSMLKCGEIKQTLGKKSVQSVQHQH